MEKEVLLEHLEKVSDVEYYFSLTGKPTWHKGEVAGCMFIVKNKSDEYRLRGCLGFGVSRSNAGFFDSDKEVFQEIRESQIPIIGSILRKTDADRGEKDKF